MLEGKFNFFHITRVPKVTTGAKKHFLVFFVALLSH